MLSKNISIIIIGGLNTDMIAYRVNKILNPGELTTGEYIQFGPGGKSRNIANMIACLAGKNKVAMVGRSSRDPYNLWKLPMMALNKSGVKTDYVKILPFNKTKKFPGIALIPVDKNGNNQIYVLPGVNNNFCPKDIDDATPIFNTAQKNDGILAFALELPLKTAIYATKKANIHNLKVLIDPGGINENTDYSELLSSGIYLFKPNEHEIRILTGIKVSDFNTAKKAAARLLQKNIRNIMITAGEKGAYLFNKELQMQIPIPKIKHGKIKDETGCGDQTMATLCYSLASGKDIVQSARLAVLSGTIQFYKLGISPVKREELL